MGHGESKLGGAYEPKVKEMLANGQDPKDYLIEYCRPECKKWEDKLRRCETALKNMTNADPEMTWYLFINPACILLEIGSLV